LAGYNLILEESFTNEGIFTNPGVVTFNGSTGGAIFSGSGIFDNLIFAGAGSWILQDALNVDGNLTITSGTLATGSNSVNLAGNFINSDTFTTSGTVTFDAADTGKTINSGTATFNNLTFDGTGSWSLASPLDVNGNLTVSTGTLTAGTKSINIAGNFTNNATFTTSGTVTFDGLVSGKTIQSGTTIFNNLTIDGAGGAWSLRNKLNVDNVLTIEAGTLDLNGFGLEFITPPAIPFVNRGTLKLIGTETLTPSSFPNDTTGGTVEYYGTGSYTGLKAGNNYYNLSFSSAGGNYTLTAPLAVNNNLAFTAALSLDTGTHSITIGGDFSNQGSALGGEGTVIFIDANKISTISASTTFYNFTCQTAGKTLKFQAGTLQTISNNLTLIGEGKNPIALRSTQSAGSDEERHWEIKLEPAGEKNIYGVDVKDSWNISSEVFTVTFSADSGNNQGWVFTPASFVWVGAFSSNWGDGRNWDLEYVPNPTDTVTIGSTARNPILDESREIVSLTIEQGGVLELEGYNFTLTGAFINEGKLMLWGSAAQTLSGFSNYISDGTVEYNGVSEPSYTGLIAGDTYYNLIFSGTTYNLNNALEVNNDLIVSTGTLAAGINSINIGGSFTNNAAFTTSGTVTFDAADTGKTINSGTATFNNLTFDGIGSWNLANALDVDGDLAINTGTLAAGSNSVTIGGNFTNNAAFTTSGTVTFDGAGGTVKSGTAVFYNLTFDGIG
ncbi:MAG: hypothetical protein KKG50_08655, partial [Candidatus Omnitrophica bacterium]|nr:hypothetical protein [Candidatus Omnitrophota bacterium]